MSSDFSNYRLGRRPHDAVRVAAVTPHVMGATPIPATVQRNFTWTPSLVDNDVDPTCTIAGLINSARVRSLLKGFDLTSNDATMLAFYAALAGCADTPEAIQATDGLVLLDVLEAAQAGRFTAGEQSPLVPEFSAIDVSNAAAIRHAIATQGNAYAGVTLRESDVAPDAQWQGGIQDAGDVVGGHCILLFAYTPTGFTAATWGETIQADDEWLMSRIDEAYALEWTMPVAP